MIQHRHFRADELPFAILPSDRRFYDADLQAEESATCSRCGEVIPEGMAVLAFQQDGLYQYRFHPACLGFQTFEDDDDDYDPA